MAHRPMAVAGTFYPATASDLSRQLDDFLGAVPPSDADAPCPKAIIAPHAGYIYSGPVAASAYARLRPLRGVVQRVILVGPAHRVAFQGIAYDDSDAWETPFGLVPIDRQAVQSIRLCSMVGTLAAAHAQEHSLEVHVPFLQHVLGEFSLVPLVVGDASADDVAGVLSALWGGRETLLVISTDLSHYLDYEGCRLADARTVTAIQSLDGSVLESVDACGVRPVKGLLQEARRRHLRIETLDVRNSGDVAGHRDRVVGYGAWALYEPALAAVMGAEERSLRALAPVLLNLAWASIRHGLEHGKPVGLSLSSDLPPVLLALGACFVTLKQNGQLRGCIGTILSYRSLVEDVAENAFKAAFADPRFAPLTARDVTPDAQGAGTITLSVSVLTKPQPISCADQADLLRQLRPGQDGLIIEDLGKRAVFLPSVWEQLPDPAAFLAHLKQKAGLGVDHWSESFAASIFQAVELKA